MRPLPYPRHQKLLPLRARAPPKRRPGPTPAAAPRSVIADWSTAAVRLLISHFKSHQTASISAGRRASAS